MVRSRVAGNLGLMRPLASAAGRLRPWASREAALIFAVALVPRLAHWWFVRASPLAGEFVPDLSAYLYAAQRLLAGAYFFVEPMVMSPGYALALAPQYLLLGPNVSAFVLVNAVLDAGSAALCAGLAARLAQGAAGVATGLGALPRFAPDAPDAPDASEAGVASSCGVATVARAEAAGVAAVPSSDSAAATAFSAAASSSVGMVGDSSKLSGADAATGLAPVGLAPVGLAPVGLAATLRARRAGLAAGLLYALCGPIVFYTLLPLGEGPSIFCLLLGLSLLFSAHDRSGAGGLPPRPGMLARGVDEAASGVAGADVAASRGAGGRAEGAATGLTAGGAAAAEVDSLAKTPAGLPKSSRAKSQKACLAPWLAGIMFALAALMRPNLAPAIVLALAVWAALAWRAAKRPVSAFAAATGAVSGPAPGPVANNATGIPPDFVPGSAPGLAAKAASAPGPDFAPGSVPNPAPQLAQILVRCLLGFALALAPFMAHNAAVAGRASPFGFQGGFTLYSGNHLGASGVGDALPGFENTPFLVLVQAWQRAEAGEGRPLTQAEADGWWYGQTWRFFAENPAEGALLLGRKALLLLNNQGVDATANIEFSARFSPVPGLLALPAGLVLALGAAGLALCWRRSPETAALAVLFAVQAGLLVLFQVTPRYRVVLLPLALIFAGVACAELPGLLFRREKQRPTGSLRPTGLGQESQDQGGQGGLLHPAGQGRRAWRVAAGPIAALALVLGLSLLPLRLLVFRPGLAAQEHARLARYYLLRGPQALAEVEYRAALALGAPGTQRLKAELRASRLLRGQDAAPAIAA